MHIFRHILALLQECRLEILEKEVIVIDIREVTNLTSITRRVTIGPMQVVTEIGRLLGECLSIVITNIRAL